ncbi:MAG: hypothetical protein JW871_08830, partial [Endomicrobiales bacterium]|nr:hypothetical protein [Endomicrobiales bacterium]
MKSKLLLILILVFVFSQFTSILAGLNSQITCRKIFLGSVKGDDAFSLNCIFNNLSKTAVALAMNKAFPLNENKSKAASKNKSDSKHNNPAYLHSGYVFSLSLAGVVLSDIIYPVLHDKEPPEDPVGKRKNKHKQDLLIFLLLLALLYLLPRGSIDSIALTIANIKDFYPTCNSSRVFYFLMDLNTKKFIAVITCLCFIFSFVISQPLHAVIEQRRDASRFKKIFDNFIIPASYGRITELHDARSSVGESPESSIENQVVVNIQDLHCHPEIQRNIAKIIETLDKKYGLEHVYVEGACGPVNTEWLSNIGDKRMNEKIINALIDNGRLTGAEYYSIKSGRPDLLVGVDNRNLHNENLLRLGKIFNKQETICGAIDNLQDNLDILKDKHFSSSNKKLEKLVKEHNKGKVESRDYYDSLINRANDLGIITNVFNVQKYGNIVNFLKTAKISKELRFDKVASELREFLIFLKRELPFDSYNLLVTKTDNFTKGNELYLYLSSIVKEYNVRQIDNYPNLKKFLEYLESNREVNPVALIKEENRLLREIRIRLAEEQSEREVIFLINFTESLKDYLSYKASAGSFEYIQQNLKKYNILWARYVGNDKLSRISPFVELLNKYYQVNIKRNECLLNNCKIVDPRCSILDTRNKSLAFDSARIQNRVSSIKNKILKSQNKNDISDLLSTTDKIIVLVTGGFHTQGITQILKKESTPYIVITPNITKDAKSSEEIYSQILKEQNKIVQKTEDRVQQTLTNIFPHFLPLPWGERRKGEGAYNSFQLHLFANSLSLGQEDQGFLLTAAAHIYKAAVEQGEEPQKVRDALERSLSNLPNKWYKEISFTLNVADEEIKFVVAITPQDSSIPQQRKVVKSDKDGNLTIYDEDMDTPIGTGEIEQVVPGYVGIGEIFSKYNSPDKSDWKRLPFSDKWKLFKAATIHVPKFEADDIAGIFMPEGVMIAWNEVVDSAPFRTFLGLHGISRLQPEQTSEQAMKEKSLTFGLRLIYLAMKMVFWTYTLTNWDGFLRITNKCTHALYNTLAIVLHKPLLIKRNVKIQDSRPDPNITNIIKEKLEKYMNQPPIAQTGEDVKYEHTVPFDELIEFGEVVHAQWPWLRPVYALAEPSSEDGKPVYFLMSPDTENGRNVARQAYAEGNPVAMLFEIAYEYTKMKKDKETGASGIHGRLLVSPCIEDDVMQFVCYHGCGVTPSFYNKQLNENFAVGYPISGFCSSDNGTKRKEIAEKLIQANPVTGRPSKVKVPVVERLVALEYVWSKVLGKLSVNQDELGRVQGAMLNTERTDWQDPVFVTYKPQRMEDLLRLEDMISMPKSMRLAIMRDVLKNNGQQVPEKEGLLVYEYSKYIARKASTQMAYWFGKGYIHGAITINNVTASGNFADVPSAEVFDELSRDVISAVKQLQVVLRVNLKLIASKHLDFAETTRIVGQELFSGFMSADTPGFWDLMRLMLYGDLLYYFRYSDSEYDTLEIDELIFSADEERRELFMGVYEIVCDELVQAGILEKKEPFVYRVIRRDRSMIMEIESVISTFFSGHTIAPDRENPEWEPLRLARVFSKAKSTFFKATPVSRRGSQITPGGLAMRAWARNYEGQTLDCTSADLVEIFGLSKIQVFRILRENDISLRRGAPRKSESNAMHDWAKEHGNQVIYESVQELAERFGLSTKQVYRILKQYNIALVSEIEREIGTISQEEKELKGNEREILIAWAIEHQNQQVEETIQDLQQEFSEINRRVIYRILERFNIKLSVAPKSTGGKALLDWCKQWQNQKVKETAEQLSDMFGVTVRTVYRRLKEYNITPDTSKRKRSLMTLQTSKELEDIEWSIFFPFQKYPFKGNLNKDYLEYTSGGKASWRLIVAAVNYAPVREFWASLNRKDFYRSHFIDEEGNFDEKAMEEYEAIHKINWLKAGISAIWLSMIAAASIMPIPLITAATAFGIP